MNLGSVLFECLLSGIEGEISRLKESNALHSYKAKSGVIGGQASALNHILQEHTLRYIALREFYGRPACARVTFETEKRGGSGQPIDLVLCHNKAEYAFEFKRWQTDKEKRLILEKDYDNLTGFVKEGKEGADRRAYSLIFTDNDLGDLGLKDPDDKALKDRYKQYFCEDLGSKYSLCRSEHRRFDDFAICLFLASPIGLTDSPC